MILIELVGITVMLTLGWKIVISEDMLLERVGYWLTDKVNQGNKIFELWLCPWCTTFFALVAFGFAFGMDLLPFVCSLKNILLLPLTICGSSFVSGMLWNLYETLNRVRENNESQSEYFKSINYETEILEENHWDSIN